MRALLYLTVRRWANSLRQIPRTPRLFLPILFFAALFALQLAPYLMAHHAATAKAAAPPPYLTGWALTEGGPGGFILGVRAVLLLSVFTSAITALNEGNLFFDASDIDFLFPAPFRRRTVLFFRMTARYTALLFPAVYLPVVMGGLVVASEANVSPVALWPGMLGAWLFLVASANFAQTSVVARGDRDGESDEGRSLAAERGERRRAALRTTLGVLLAVGLLAGVFYVLPLLTVDDSARGDRALHWLLCAGNGRGATTLLAPIAWAADLFRVPFEGWTGAAFARLAGLAALTAASFVALFARDRDFYEGATALSTRRQNVRAALRGGDTGALLSQMAQEGKLGRGFAVTPFGGGARALVWKNLTAVTRTPLRGWLNLLVLAAFPALITLLLGHQRTDVGLLIWTVTFALQMSGVFLVDLRGMLRRADLSKALPIAPLGFLLGELAVPAAQLTLLGYLSLTLLTLTGNGRGPLLAVAYLVFPSVAALLLLVQTAFVLLYPQQNDVAQHTISNLMGLFVSGLAIAPAAVTGILLHYAGAPPWALGAGIAGVNIAASAIVALADAALWARFDPTG